MGRSLRLDIFMVAFFDVQDNIIVGHVFSGVNIRTVQLHESL